MKKQLPTTATTDKLTLNAETLRKMSESLDDDQLLAVVGGQKKGTVSRPVGC